MEPVAIPDHVRANWRDWWPDEADAIATAMPGRLAAALAAWQLRDPVALGEGEVALVFAVLGADGHEAVLKLNPAAARDPELADEHRALALWAGAGAAPRVYGTRDEGRTLLLERIRPGAHLPAGPADAERILEVLGTLARRLHVPVPAGTFGSLAASANARSWRDSLADPRDRDELADLLSPVGDERLLHLDLHRLNALSTGGGWVAIDPKPLAGDPCAEVFGFLDGPPLTSLPAAEPAARVHVTRLIAVYATAAGLDPVRVGRWLRIRTLAYAAQLDPAHVKTAQLLGLARALG